MDWADHPKTLLGGQTSKVPMVSSASAMGLGIMGSADWFTVKIWPATRICPLRAAAPVFCDAEKVTWPLPKLVRLDVIVIQALVLRTFHSQLDGELMKTVPVNGA